MRSASAFAPEITLSLIIVASRSALLIIFSAYVVAFSVIVVACLYAVYNVVSASTYALVITGRA